MSRPHSPHTAGPANNLSPEIASEEPHKCHARSTAPLSAAEDALQTNQKDAN